MSNLVVLKGTAFDILRATPGELCRVVDIALKQGTTDLMKAPEKDFGKKITTSTWNTVERIAALLKS